MFFLHKKLYTGNGRAGVGFDPFGNWMVKSRILGYVAKQP